MYIVYKQKTAKYYELEERSQERARIRRAQNAEKRGSVASIRRSSERNNHAIH